MIAPPVRARYCDADGRIIEGIARWLSEHSAGRPDAARAPERQILLFHGIVNSRQRVLMPVPSRGGTHEISAPRLYLVADPLVRSFARFVCRSSSRVVIHRASISRPRALTSQSMSCLEGGCALQRGRTRDDSAIKKFRPDVTFKRRVCHVTPSPSISIAVFRALRIKRRGS